MTTTNDVAASMSSNKPNTKVEAIDQTAQTTRLLHGASSGSIVLNSREETNGSKDDAIEAAAKTTTASSNEEEQPEPISCRQRSWNRTCQFYWDNEFVCLVVLAILLARAYPPLGAVYLAPDITSTWIVVIFIFIMAGLELKTEEFSKAFQRLWFNFVVQVFNFGVVSSVVFGVSRGLDAVTSGFEPLADGMVICACLPLTINMVMILTKIAGGDEASAIFNAAFGNILGVFLSPLLILGYLGVSGDVELWEIFYKLALRVVAPVMVGQVLQKFCPPVVAFTKKYKKRLKQAQQYCLIFIVYTVFCTTFADAAENKENNASSSIGDIFIMIAVQFCLLCGLTALSWYTFGFFFRDEPTLRVMGLFGSTHKTVAMGVPLINAIYEGNPLVGLYTLPLLIWHPIQLVVGSYLAPKLAAWVEREQRRLGTWKEEDENDEDQGGSDDAATSAQHEEEGALSGSSPSDEEAPSSPTTAADVPTTPAAADPVSSTTTATTT